MTDSSHPENARGEFRTGWRLLLSAGVGIGFGIAPIPFNVIGHLVLPLQAEFGWSRGEILLAITVLGVTVTLLAPGFGLMVDRLGVRPVAIGATIGFGLSWALLAATPDSLLAFYALWVLMAIVGGASIPVSWTRGVAGHFERNRGLALAIVLAFTGVAALVVNLLVPGLIEAGGWRWAILGTALLPLAVSLPLALAFFRVPGSADAAAAATATGVAFSDAMADRRFWLMFAGIGLVALAYGGLYANFVPLLRDAGFTAAAAGRQAALLGVSIVIGRLLVGWLLDRYWAPAVAFPFLAAPAAICLLLAVDGVTPIEATVAAILLGFAAGAETDLIAYLATRYFGLAHYGRIYGALYVAFGLGSAVAAPLFGWSFDVTGSYALVLRVAAVLFVSGATLLLLIGPYPMYTKAR